mgnify:CR=1 FL=1
MIMNPSTIKDVVIDGHSLTIESFVAVVRFGAKVSVAKEALDAMQKSRDLAEKIASEKRVAYVLAILPALLFQKRCPILFPPI